MYPDYIPPVRTEQEDWDSLSPEEQERYNRRITAENTLTHAKDRYDTAMSLKGPFILAVLGLLLIPVGIGIVLMILAIIWEFIRIAAHGQAYQEYKDAQHNFEIVNKG